MEGRYPTAILLVLANCGNPAQEEEFNRWYNDIHIGDVTRSGLLENATRYQSVTMPNLAPGEAKYLAIFETQWQDMAAFYQENLKEREYRREHAQMNPNSQVVLAGLFQSIGPEFRSGSAKKTKGIQVNFTDCTDSSREEEFNQWWDNIHMPDILETGAYHTAYRYKSIDLGSVSGKYVAIYETDWEDPWEARLETWHRHRSQWIREGRYSDIMNVSRVGVYKPIWP